MKAIAAALITAVLCLVLIRQGKDIALLLTLGACCMIALVAVTYLEQVMDFLSRLEELTGLDHDLMELLLKIVGLGIIGEFAAMVCNDAGNSALGKVIQILSAVVILWMSLPLFETLLELINSTLGEI